MDAQVSDNVKPWTVRGIAPEERNAASEAAKRDGLSLGDWLSRAIRTHIQQGAAASRLPVPVRQAPSDTASMLSDVERIASSLRDLSAAGVPVPKGHAGRVHPRPGGPAAAQAKEGGPHAGPV